MTQGKNKNKEGKKNKIKTIKTIKKEPLENENPKETDKGIYGQPFNGVSAKARAKRIKRKDNNNNNVEKNDSKKNNNNGNTNIEPLGPSHTKQNPDQLT